MPFNVNILDLLLYIALSSNFDNVTLDDGSKIWDIYSYYDYAEKNSDEDWVKNSKYLLGFEDQGMAYITEVFNDGFEISEDYFLMIIFDEKKFRKPLCSLS